MCKLHRLKLIVLAAVKVQSRSPETLRANLQSVFVGGVGNFLTDGSKLDQAVKNKNECAGACAFESDAL
eukprot:2273573-Pleurochrysis_carterae.AAC.1